MGYVGGYEKKKLASVFGHGNDDGPTLFHFLLEPLLNS